MYDSEAGAVAIVYQKPSRQGAWGISTPTQLFHPLTSAVRILRVKPNQKCRAG